jgi:serine/threonine-protein kinase
MLRPLDAPSPVSLEREMMTLRAITSSTLVNGDRTWIGWDGSARSAIPPRAVPTTDSRMRRGRVEPGWRLGPYVLEEPIGAGSQAVIWRAVQTEPITREVAIKLHTCCQGEDPRRLARFRREAARGMRLASPSIMPVYDFGEADGLLYMVMPLLDGVSLQEIIARRKDSCDESKAEDHWLSFLPDAEYMRAIVRILTRITRGLAEAHAAFVVHRDVKPANILVDRLGEDRAFLCDFGLSRDLDVATLEQMRDGSGTPLYMAPEKLLGCHVDEVRCDVYSMGVTLFEALTLTRPFEVPESCSRPAWAYCLATQKPLLPREVQPNFPRELERIVMSAMAADPAKRPHTANALADELERFLASERRVARTQLSHRRRLVGSSRKNALSDSMFPRRARTNPTNPGDRLNPPTLSGSPIGAPVRPDHSQRV